MATYTEANNGSVVIYEGTRFGCVPDLLNLVDENGQERELPSSGAKQKSSTRTYSHPYIQRKLSISLLSPLLSPPAPVFYNHHNITT